MRKFFLMALFATIFTTEIAKSQNITPFLMMGMVQYEENSSQLLAPFFTAGADIDRLGNLYIVPRFEFVAHTAFSKFNLTEIKFGAKAGYAFTYVKPYGILLFSYPIAESDKLVRGIVGAGIETSSLGRFGLGIEIQFDQREYEFSDGFLFQAGVRYSL